MPEDSGQHWRNQIEVFEEYTLPALKNKLNEFFKDKFVIATQIFPTTKLGQKAFDAVVYYKVPPNSN